MEKEPPIQSSFKRLEVDLPLVRQENNLFWWLAGIALALCVMALTLHYYALHKQEKQRATHSKQLLSHKEAPPGGAL